MFFPDHRSEFFHPGSRVKKIPDPGSGSASASKNVSIFNPKNCFSALGNMIRDVHPGSGFLFFTLLGPRLQGPKRHQIPNPGTAILALLNDLKKNRHLPDENKNSTKNSSRSGTWYRTQLLKQN
jgi:hypothetical protein